MRVRCSVKEREDKERGGERERERWSRAREGGAGGEMEQWRA